MKTIIDNLMKIIVRQKDLSVEKGEKGEVIGKSKEGTIKVTPLFQDDSFFVTKIENDGRIECIYDGFELSGNWMEFTLCLEGESTLSKDGDHKYLSRDRVMVYDGSKVLPSCSIIFQDFRGINISLKDKFMEVGIDQDMNLSIAKFWEKEKSQLLLGDSWTLRNGDSTLYTLCNHLFYEVVNTPMDYLHMKRETLEIIQVLFESFFRKEDLWKRILKMNEDLEEGEYTLGDLSNLLNISKYKINQHFLQVHGRTYSDYMRQRKIETACHLLRDTRNSILDIASEVGFENPGKFSAMFKREVGFTPREYRKKLDSD
ncbi:MAG: AraC family transcriptional regulator [Tissierellia bacterium]|nr:AraC family transcriptional regulator [Tissierellia bacterium]